MRQNQAIAFALTVAVSLCGCHQFVPMVNRGFDRVERFASGGRSPETAATAADPAYEATPQGMHQTINTASVRSENPFADADPFLSSPVVAPPVHATPAPPAADFQHLTVLSVPGQSMPGEHTAARPSTGPAVGATAAAGHDVRRMESTMSGASGWQPTQHAN